MLSMAKVVRGRQGYYLATVATGREHDGGLIEPDGVWLGGAAAELGLSGVVTAPALDSVLAGRHPSSGEVLSPSHRRVEVAGFDCTFSPPKSVSILHALGPDAARGEVLAGHEAAVAACVGYLEREALRVRRRVVGAPGAQGAQRAPGEPGEPAVRSSVAAGGVVAAAFVHRSSRAPDPHLHTHVLVANCAPGPDGRWTALDARPLFLGLGTASHLYEAQLRREVGERLGLRFGPMRGCWADLEGFDECLLRAFSRRSAEIEALLAERGFDGPGARRMAALATRPPKDLTVEYESLVAGWHEMAAEVGLPVGRLGRMVESGRDRRGMGGSPATGAAAERKHWVDQVLGPEGLTARGASFSRQDLIRDRCRALPEGADVKEVEAVVDDLLASPKVVERGEITRTLRDRGGCGQVPAATERRFTTPEVVAIEDSIADRARAGRSVGAGVATADTVAGTLRARPGLGDAGLVAFGRLLTSGDAIEVVTGASGIDATDALEAARAGWAASGLAVSGVAPDRSAARRLEATTGIECVSPGEMSLPAARDRGRSAVIVVAAAERVGPRRLSALLDQASASGSKVVLAVENGTGGPDARAVRGAALAGAGLGRGAALAGGELGRGTALAGGGPGHGEGELPDPGREGARAVAGEPSPASHSPAAEWLDVAGLEVGLAATAADARAAAVAAFRALRAAGRPALLVAPDKSTAAVLLPEGEAAGVVSPREAAMAVRVAPAAGPHLVVLGEAALLPWDVRRSGTARTHVVVDRDEDTRSRRARAAEVALPGRVLRALGAPPRGSEGRAAWRRAALAAEEQREMERSPGGADRRRLDLAESQLRDARRGLDEARRSVGPTRAPDRGAALGR